VPNWQGTAWQTGPAQTADEPWSEQVPIDNTSVGLNTGGIFGSGNTDPFIFSYTSGVHWRITYGAARWAGLSDMLAQALAAGVASVDHGTQGIKPGMTHVHAMAAPGERCIDAYNSTVSQVGGDMRRAAQGDANAEVRALHTIQDSYSGAHGFQTWNGKLTFGHVWQDSWPRTSAPDDATGTFLQALKAGTLGKIDPRSLLYRPACAE